MKKKMAAMLACLLLCLNALAAGVTASAAGSDGTAAKTPQQTAVRFSDVPADAYFAPAVAWAVEREITNGTSPTAFSPSAICTRAQVVTFLWRARGCPESDAANPFSDVWKSAYYYKPVLWAIENAVTNGITEKAFAPRQRCSHAQILTMIWRDAGSPAASTMGTIAAAYQDHWAADALAWAEENGLLTEKADAFKPNDACPRADVVFYLYQCDISSAEPEGETDLYNNSILYKAASQEDFASAVVQLIQEYENQVTVTIQNGEYASGRLIVKANALPSLEDYHAVRIVQDLEGHFVIQFTKDSDAEECAAYLRTFQDVEYAEADGIVTADADGENGAGDFSVGIA